MLKLNGLNEMFGKFDKFYIGMSDLFCFTNSALLKIQSK